MEAAQVLAGKGYFVPAIRFPTVARDAARLRVTISARHTPKQISGLCAVLRRMVGRREAGGGRERGASKKRQPSGRSWGGNDLQLFTGGGARPDPGRCCSAPLRRNAALFGRWAPFSPCRGFHRAAGDQRLRRAPKE